MAARAPSSLTPASDRELLRSFVATREEAAFAEIVRRYLPLTMGAAMRRLNSRAMAEEAVQDTFVILAKKASSVPPERLAAWLHRTAFLEACAAARREQRFERSHAGSPSTPSPVMPAADAFEDLDKALQSLPELDRELLLRRYTFGETVREIAARTGLSEEACQKRLERTLARLRSQLGTPTAATILAGALPHMAAGPAGAGLVNKLTAGALQQGLSSPGGLIGGTMLGKVAACAAAAALGSALAWARPSGSASPVVTAPSGVANRSPLPLRPAPPVTPGLTARPAMLSRSLTDVLDSIHSGRLGPLVEILPQATVADLQAILREDDMANLGERSMQRIPAHWVALRHWASLEPATAWQYAVSRDRESPGHDFHAAASLVFAIWVKNDPPTAWQAFDRMPVPDRARVANAMVLMDGAAAETIMERYPEHYWRMAECRQQYGKTPEQGLEEAQRIVRAALQGESTGLRNWEVAKAFATLMTAEDPSTMEQARAIPDEATRHAVLALLARQFPDAFPVPSVPAGKIRQDLIKARYAAKLGKEDLPLPEEPLLQAAWLETRGAALAYDHPLHLLHCLATARIAGQEVNVHEPGGYTAGPSWLEAAVRNAALEDPQRTVQLLPDVIRNLPDVHVPAVLDQVIRSWVRKDPAEAIRWTLQRDLEGLEGKLHSALQEMDRGGERLLAMLPASTEAEQPWLLMGLAACYQDVLAGPDPSAILQQVAPEQADALLRRTLQGSMGRGAWEEALRVAGHASPDERLGYLLPNLATVWLNKQPAEATAWINRLPREEREAVLAKAGSHYEFTEAGRRAFEQIQP